MYPGFIPFSLIGLPCLMAAATGMVLLLLLSGDLSGGTLVGAFTGLLDIVDLAICEKD